MGPAEIRNRALEVRDWDWPSVKIILSETFRKKELIVSTNPKWIEKDLGAVL